MYWLYRPQVELSPGPGANDTPPLPPGPSATVGRAERGTEGAGGPLYVEAYTSTPRQIGEEWLRGRASPGPAMYAGARTPRLLAAAPSWSFPAQPRPKTVAGVRPADEQKTGAMSCW